MQPTNVNEQKEKFGMNTVKDVEYTPNKVKESKDLDNVVEID